MAFFTAIALTVIAYLTMYVLMFISYLVLKVKKSDNPRRFNLPAPLGWVAALVGLGSTIFAFVVAFAKPDEISKAMYGNYLTILIVAYLAIVILPHVVCHFSRKREKSWQKEIAAMMKNGETFQTKASIK